MGKRLKLTLCGAAIAASLLGVIGTVQFKRTSWKTQLKLKAQFFPSPRWMLDQIHEDLALVDASQLTPAQIASTMCEIEALNPSYMLVHYHIRNNVLSANYFSGLENHSRAKVLMNELNDLLSVLHVPDVDFIVSLADGAIGCHFKSPVFSFAKDRAERNEVILIPDFEALSGNEKLLRRIREGLANNSWNERLPKAIWRGAMTGAADITDESFLQFPRARLVSSSIAHPELLDAKFNTVTQCSTPEKVKEVYGHYFADTLKVIDHIPYKYQILLDGNTCAYSRAFWQLFSQSVIFKQDSSHIQWYYRALTPFVHYIPIRADLSDLSKKIEWAQTHDTECQKISRNAQRFAESHLRKPDVYLYFYLLLSEYAKIQGNPNG
ncbi:MAG: glycosyl transferase family 90 [Chlamydiota bacterium]